MLVLRVRKKSSTLCTYPKGKRASSLEAERGLRVSLLKIEDQVEVLYLMHYAETPILQGSLMRLRIKQNSFLYSHIDPLGVQTRAAPILLPFFA